MTRKKLKVSAILFILLLSLNSCSFPLFRSQARRTEIQMSGHTRNFKESGKVRKAKKQQESRQAKLKRDYNRSVKNSKKRTYDIQTPEVKERMRRNESAIKARENKKNKRDRGSDKAAKKYKSIN
jgi:hypothetical protein